MPAPQQSTLNLTAKPETMSWPETHYIFVEKTGPFQTSAPEAWQTLNRLLQDISKNHQITGYFALYQLESQVYRAGVSVSAEPDHLPAKAAYKKFPGGKYARLTYTGPYSNLPAASGLAFEIIHDSKLPLRDDYNIENYVNSPMTTPEDQLITEILFPLA